MQQKLKDARAEIEAILKKHDIAGFVSLHAPGFGEVFYTIWPSYSILVGDYPSIRIKSKAADYAGDVARQLADQANTAGMAHHLGMSLSQFGMQFLDISTALTQQLGVEHVEQSFEPEPSKMNPGVH
ncbi:hypothetical protein [Polaromonas sp.]|uniref:hypothetical protein n=1 Tax=Polaromonas sp. TaxID=1869339 RepID=UPI002730DB3B|nr:hypothetical protein [Polaromonas sp.]